MNAAALELALRVTSIPLVSLPANCEVLARTYVGDQAYGVLRHPKSRALYLTSGAGFFELDIAHVLATFSESLRAWDRVRAWSTGAAVAARVGVELGGTRPSHARRRVASTKRARVARLRPMRKAS